MQKLFEFLTQIIFPILSFVTPLQLKTKNLIPDRILQLQNRPPRIAIRTVAVLLQARQCFSRLDHSLLAVLVVRKQTTTFRKHMFPSTISSDFRIQRGLMRAITTVPQIHRHNCVRDFFSENRPVNASFNVYFFFKSRSSTKRGAERIRANLITSGWRRKCAN